MPKAIGLFHATLPVWDLERAERFWRDLLGIERHPIPSYKPDSVVFLDLGNTMLHLVRCGDGVTRPDPRSTHIAIEVDNLEDGLEAVRLRGLEVVSDILTRSDGSRCFYFIDSESNRIEFISHPTALAFLAHD